MSTALKADLRNSLDLPQEDDLGELIRSVWAIIDRLPEFDQAHYTEWGALTSAISVLQDQARRKVLG